MPPIAATAWDTRSWEGSVRLARVRLSTVWTPPGPGEFEAGRRGGRFRSTAVRTRSRHCVRLAVGVSGEGTRPGTGQSDARGGSGPVPRDRTPCWFGFVWPATGAWRLAAAIALVVRP